MWLISAGGGKLWLKYWNMWKNVVLIQFLSPFWEQTTIFHIGVRTLGTYRLTQGTAYGETYDFIAGYVSLCNTVKCGIYALRRIFWIAEISGEHIFRRVYIWGYYCVPAKWYNRRQILHISVSVYQITSSKRGKYILRHSKSAKLHEI